MKKDIRSLQKEGKCGMNKIYPIFFRVIWKLRKCYKITSQLELKPKEFKWKKIGKINQNKMKLTDKNKLPNQIKKLNLELLKRKKEEEKRKHDYHL